MNKRFFDYSRNAVKTLVGIMASVYGLIASIYKDLGSSTPLSTM